jgi:hypothetical protein
MGRGTSLFSIHFVSSLPKKIISDGPVEPGDWPWLMKTGKERVSKTRRQMLKIFVNSFNMFYTQC